MHKGASALFPEEGTNILYISKEPDTLMQRLTEQGFVCQHQTDPFLAYVKCLSEVYAQKPLPYAIICREDFSNEEAFTLLENLQKCSQLKGVPRILYSPSEKPATLKKAKLAGADDFYYGTFPLSDLLDRLSFLRETKSQDYSEEINTKPYPKLQISTAKRLFDILFSSLALLLLGPFLLLIALLVKLESKGPAFYVSKRVGTGYRIFDFYKFRSMRADADTMMEQLIHLNQYKGVNEPTFIKIDKDPRVTRIGRFLRDTSLDELPQLINVLKGNMSIVGNRPLPLYEAEKITKDLWSKRFLAPAGITGLWQVTKRGKKEMSVEERIALDMTYADENCMWYDLKIVAQTIPALLQKESV